MNGSGVINRYGMDDAPLVLESMSGGRAVRPASTRIIADIAAIEKSSPELGQRLTAELFEFRRWVELQYERKLRDEGRMI